MNLDKTDNYTLRELLKIFWRWRHLALGAFFAILIPGILVTFLMPRVYEATAAILVNRSHMAPAYSVKTDQTMDSSPIMRNVNNAEETKTVGEMIKTRAIIDRTIDQLHLTHEKLKYIRDFRRYVQMAIDGVVDGAHWIYNEIKYATHLAQRPTPKERAFLDREDLVDDVINSIKITPVPESSVLRISFRSGDPYLAQNAINALVNEFISGRPRSDQTSRTFFAGEMQQSAEQLHAAESALAEYRQKTSAYSVTMQRDLLLQAIETLRANLTQTEALRTQKQAAVDTLRGELLTELRVEQRDRLKTERDVEREISKSLIDAAVDLAGYTASSATLKTAIAARMEELAKLNAAEVRSKELERQVTKEEQAYELQRRNLEQARVTEQLANAHLSDLRLVDHASFPLSPVRPRTWIYLGIALGAAVLAMLAAPFLAHQNDTTLASHRDVASLLDISFVATIPNIKLTTARRGSPRRLGQAQQAQGRLEVRDYILKQIASPAQDAVGEVPKIS